MKRIAIIPARGGSKRIPRKNIKVFCGRPILEYSIEAALESKLFDLVLVSTDDEEISDIAISCGASVPFLRGQETSGDMATTADVIQEVLSKLEGEGQIFEQGCCIYPTAPFVTTDKLIRSIQMLDNAKCDSVVPVVRYSFPIQRSLKIEDGFVRFTNPQSYNLRSQDLEPMYHDCGQFYTFDVKMFETDHSLVTENTLAMVLSETEIHDIDNYDDWIIAEIKYEAMRRRMRRDGKC